MRTDFCKKLNVIQMTPGDKEYFFGYYDKCPWNASGNYILAHQTDFSERSPGKDDKVVLGTVDVSKAGVFEAISETRAWSWQQGAMLQWHPASAEDTIIYNDCIDGQFVSVVLNTASAERRILPRPVASVSRDGSTALSLNFARLAKERPGYGYAGVKDIWENEIASDADGIYRMNMETGKNELIISLAEMAAMDHCSAAADGKHWFNHLMFSPDGSRFVFLHRWRKAEGSHSTQMVTASVDGSDIYILNDHEMTSHFDWWNNQRILAFARRHDLGDKYFMFNDRSDDVEVVGDEELTPLYDGHCTRSPNGKWILTDAYPDKNNERLLLLYDPVGDVRVDLGRFFEKPWKADEFRCDLHPRWSRDGRQICFDSLHSGTRQVYIMDISEIVG